jgi:ribosome modulation factor
MPDRSKDASDPHLKPLDREAEARAAADSEACAAADDEAERLGRVAHHHGKFEDDTPYGTDDPRSKRWLAGIVAARKRTPRSDLPRAEAMGFLGFEDGVHRSECPVTSRSVDQKDWLAGWDLARLAKDEHDAKTPR